jgi:hypothetical protein
MQAADGQHVRFPAERMTARQRASAALRRAGAMTRAAAAALAAPALVLCAMLLAAATCTVVGVHILAGPGWAYIAAAAVLFVLAACLARGLTGG